MAKPLPAPERAPRRRVRKRQRSDTHLVAAPGPVLALAPLDAPEAAVMRRHVERTAGCECVGSVVELTRRRDLAATPPQALFVPGGARLAGRMAAIQAHPTLRDVPAIAVVSVPDPQTFRAAFAAGMDDCCADSPHALAHKLAAAKAFPRRRTEHQSATVVVAHEHHPTRVGLARLFRRVGYHVKAVGMPSDCEAACRETQPVAVVVGDAIVRWGARGGPAERWLAELAPEAAWIVTAAAGGLATLREEMAAVRGVKVSVQPEEATPSTVLYLANAIRNPSGAEQRRGPRKVHATPVQFREAGSRHSIDGCTYNVSEEGLYVRTLTPPEPGTSIWVEMAPPGTSRRVHLEATVVWTRAYGRDAHAVAPPGFGASIDGASARDLAIYREQVAAHPDTMPGTRFSLSPESDG